MTSSTQTHKALNIKRSVPDDRYYTPLPFEIEEMLDKIGVPKEERNKIPMSVIQDICNIQSFEYFEKNPLDSLTDPDKWPPMKADEKEYHKNIQEFLRKIDYNKYPGTPLERACLIAAHLSAENESQGGGKPKPGNEDGNGEQKMEVFMPGPHRKTPEELAEDMGELAEKLKHITGFENEVLELNNLNPYQKFKKLTKGAEKMLMEISLKLEGFKRIQVSAKKTREVETHSRKKRHVKIRDLNKISKLPKIKYADPAFDYKLATKSLTYREGFVVHEEKQILMMLIDDSGSMHSATKLAWRNAVLMNRCEAVAQGKAELILYMYETGRYNRHHVKTEAEAKALVKKIIKHSPGGGGTDIEGVLRESIKEIHAMKGYKPDIMIVLDGQDHFEDMDNMGVTVHAVIIGTSHKKLEKFCKKTGGMFLHETE